MKSFRRYKFLPKGERYLQTAKELGTRCKVRPQLQRLGKAFGISLSSLLRKLRDWLPVQANMLHIGPYRLLISGKRVSLFRQLSDGVFVRARLRVNLYNSQYQFSAAPLSLIQRISLRIGRIRIWLRGLPGSADYGTKATLEKPTGRKCQCASNNPPFSLDSRYRFKAYPFNNLIRSRRVTTITSLVKLIRQIRGRVNE